MTTSVVTTLKLRLQGYIPESYREKFQNLAAGVLTFLLGYGILDDNEVTLWSQLALGTIAALFALLYSTSAVRSILYTLVGPVGAVLMWYGIISDVKWAVLVASIGQIFGVSVAGAKVVQRGVPEIESPAQAREVRKELQARAA